MIKFLKFIGTCVVIYLMARLFVISVKADTFNYSVNPILPNSLNDKGYFDYIVHTDQKIKFWFEINNNSDKTIVVKSSLNNGISDDNGRINYSFNHSKGLLKSDTPRLSSMILGDKEKFDRIKPHSSKKNFFIIKTPKKNFNGDVLGGINNSIVENVNQPIHGAVKNLVNYSTTILLRHDDKISDINKLKLKDIRVKNNVIDIQMMNNQSKIFYGYKCLVKLMKDNKTVASDKTDKYSLVPNSLGHYKMNLFNVHSGKYNVRILVYNHKSQTIFNKEVYIQNNYQFLGTNKKNNDDKYLIIVSIIVATLLILAWFIVRYFNIFGGENEN